MAADETKVVYRAIARFTDLKKATLAARKDLESLRKEEAKTNKASVEWSKKVAAAHRDATKALRSRTTSTKTATTALIKYNTELRKNRDLLKSSGDAALDSASKVKTAAKATKEAADENSKLAKEAKGAASGMKQAADAGGDLTNTVKNSANAFQRTTSRMAAFRRAMSGANSEQRKFIPLSARVISGGNNIANTFKRIGNFRPRLIPPFVALIPLIAGLLALLNPLVAMLGAVGAAAFAAGSSLLSVGGAIIGLVPLISAAIAAIAGLVSAFNGIGGVFSKWGAAKEAIGGGGGGGKSAADQAYDLLRAQERLTDAQEAALRAQDGLNDARREAVRRLEDLRKAVARAAQAEDSAEADVQLALENYYNVLADPGSTAGQKMQALADLQNAQNNLIDTRDEAIRNAEDLAEAEKKGIEGSDEVVDAQRRLRDALREVRDAQYALEKVMRGSGGGGGGASQMDEFLKALAELSPSAQKVVLAIIAMQDAWKQLRLATQEAFFSEIVDDMDELASILPVVGRMLELAAGAMGRFVSNLIQMVASPAWKNDLNIISEQNVVLIEKFGEAMLFLLTAIKDLTIAAGPFAEDLLNSFTGLMKNFSSIVASARETGSLARWLDVVYGRLQQWWSIIKNVAKTLFNYGAASAEFGQWITDGLEALTSGWLESSERARREGSPFQVWLENIKPLLVQIRGLFGDFFRWLSATSMDTDVIAQAISILETIRTKLGPALSDFFDILSDSGIGEKFADSLASIVSALAELLALGGIDGFVVFFDMVSEFFHFLADMARNPTFGPFVSFLATFAGAIAALSFIGKFTGITALFGWIFKLASSAAVMKLLGGLGGLGSLFGGAAGAGGAAAGAGGAAAGAGGAAAGAGAAAAGTASLMSKLGSVAKALGTIGLVVTAVFQLAGNLGKQTNALIASFEALDGSLEEQRAARDLSGATQLQLLFDQLGGFLLDIFAPDWAKEVDNFLADVAKNMNDWADSWAVPLKDWWGDLVADFRDTWKPLEDEVNGGLANFWSWMTTPISFEAPESPEKGSSRPSDGDSVDKIASSALRAAEALRKLKAAQDSAMFPDEVQENLNEHLTIQESIVAVYDERRRIQEENKKALEEATTVEVESLAAMGEALTLNGQAWDTGTEAAERNRLAVLNYATAAYETAEQMRTNGASYDEYKAKLEETRQKIVDSIVAMGGNRAEAERLASAIVKIPSQKTFTLQNNIDDVARKVAEFKNVWDGKQITTSYWISLGYDRAKAAEIARLTGLAQKYLGGGAIGGLVGGSAAIGGIVSKTAQYLATGGSVRKVGDPRYNMDPRGTDTEPAMLTVGEYVVKKERVDDVGAPAMQAFNDGLIGFAALVANSKAAKKDAGVGYFSGGGLAGYSAGSYGTGAASMAKKNSSSGGDGVYINELIVNNPVPERASESTASAIRRAAYQGKGRRPYIPRLDAPMNAGASNG